MSKKKSTLNNITLTGVLVSKSLEDKIFDDKRTGHEGEQYTAIVGSVTLRTLDGSEHEVGVFSKMEKADGSISAMYQSYDRIRSEFISMAEADIENGINPTYVKVGQCGFGANIGLNKKNGKATVYSKVEGKFLNEASETDKQLAKKTAEFRVEGVIDKILPKVVNGIDTGELNVVINTINTYATKTQDGEEIDNSKIVPVNLNVPKELSTQFKTMFGVGQFTKLWGDVVNIRKEEEVTVQAGFGESTTESVVSYDVRNVIRGGLPPVPSMTKLQEYGFTQQEYDQLKSKFELELSQKENQNNVFDNQQTENQAPVMSSNPFAGM